MQMPPRASCSPDSAACMSTAPQENRDPTLGGSGGHSGPPIIDTTALNGDHVLFLATFSPAIFKSNIIFCRRCSVTTLGHFFSPMNHMNLPFVIPGGSGASGSCEARLSALSHSMSAPIKSQIKGPCRQALSRSQNVTER